MAKAQKVNPEFGAWVKTARERAKLTQEQAAKRAKISQQIWSRIERYGIIPSNEKLLNVCGAVNKPIDDAAPFVTTSNIDVRLRNYELDYLQFKRHLVQSANVENRTDLVELFILSDTQESVDDEAVNEHVVLLSTAEKFALTILFRTSNSGAWTSFRRLARRVSVRWPTTKPKEELRRKFAGYYRREENEEPPLLRLPMPHPVMLLVDGATNKPALYSYAVHGRVLNHLKDKDLPEPIAEIKSTMLWPVQSESLVTAYIDWIGAVSRFDLPPDRWHEIDWLDDTERST